MSRLSFALSIDTDCFFPYFLKGDTISVDPMKKYKNRDYIIYRASKTGENTIKQVVNKDNKLYIQDTKTKKIALLGSKDNESIVGVITEAIKTF